MPYFKLGEAFKDVKSADSPGGKAMAGASFLGKTLFNVGKFALEEALPKMVEKSGEKLLENKDLSEEDREKTIKNMAKSKVFSLKSQIREIDRKLDDLPRHALSERDSLENQKQRLEREIDSLDD